MATPGFPTILPGPRKWSATRDKDGFVDYKMTILVRCDIGDGPANILNNTPGLPVYGTPWIVPTFNEDATSLADIDIWAFFRWDAEVTPVVTEEANDLFEVTLTASNRWPSPKDGDRPYDQDPPTDPRLDPPKISGSFVRYTEEAVQDRFGSYVTNSAWELIRGPHVEFDRNRPQIHISFNSAVLPLSYLTAMTDTVNAFFLWGLPPRTIKLSEAEWELKFFGQGEFYYGLSFTFDINLGTWDRDILDEGTKVIHGEWDNGPGGSGNWLVTNIGGQTPNPLNPQHFIRFKDRNGENATVVLDGQGLPAGVNIGTGTTVTALSNAYMCRLTQTFQGQLTWTLPGDSPPGVNWIPIRVPIATKAVEWQPGVWYGPGTVVTVDANNFDFIPEDTPVPSTWLAINGILSTVYPIGFPGGDPHWIQVDDHFLPRNLGLWSPTRQYTLGDVVVVPVSLTIPAAGPHPPGVIHVEKYAESDFTLLGIPLTFPLAF